MSYTIQNKNGLLLMVVDGNKKDYSFTNEERLAQKFDTKKSANDQIRKMPLLKNLSAEKAK